MHDCNPHTGSASSDHAHPRLDGQARAHAGHGHAHGPAPPGGDGTRAFAIGTLVNLAFTALEAAYGLLTGSLALLSDALHNLGDVLGLALAWAAARLARRAANARHTYGFQRATLLAPLLNALLLVGAAGALGWEAIRRLAAPPAIETGPVIAIAALGVLVNLGTALLFRHGHAHDLNQRGAYLHLMADAAVSLAVVAGGVAIAWFGWTLLDPMLALAVSGVIVVSTWGLLRDSLALSLDAVPRGIDRDAVHEFLAARPGVTAVHHVHIWALGSRSVALTAHLVRAESDDHDRFIAQTAQALSERFGIGHSTLQLERGEDCAACD